ncbi:hypothetical protein ACFWPH_32935 [Nocardia sp. NPDC058499]|uniref:hypothetical protein n=1 Tax=Nocardia sp. NPDC058499 TaxID=3346530 RepID=UPI003669C64E
MFCREYDKIAATIDPDLVGSAPKRSQFHRWLSGEVKGLPYPHHCRVLEKMLPGHTATELFEPDTTETRHDEPPAPAQPPTSGATPWGPTQSIAEVNRREVAGNPWGIEAETERLPQLLLPLQHDRHLTDAEVGRLSELVGHIVDLDLRIDIGISADGAARVTYRYDTVNLTDQPLTRMFRELWFEHTSGALEIKPIREGPRRVAIHRTHDTPNLAKFSCQLSPALQPGESAVVGYTCDGGEFTDALYWRHSVYRYTRCLTINLRHATVGEPTTCTATEEHPNGAENTAIEDLVWDCVQGDAVITLTREYLRPNQSITLRWEIAE